LRKQNQRYVLLRRTKGDNKQRRPQNSLWNLTIIISPSFSFYHRSLYFPLPELPTQLNSAFSMKQEGFSTSLCSRSSRLRRHSPHRRHRPRIFLPLPTFLSSMSIPRGSRRQRRTCLRQHPPALWSRTRRRRSPRSLRRRWQLRSPWESWRWECSPRWASSCTGTEQNTRWKLRNSFLVGFRKILRGPHHPRASSTLERWSPPERRSPNPTERTSSLLLIESLILLSLTPITVTAPVPSCSLCRRLKSRQTKATRRRQDSPTHHHRPRRKAVRRHFTRRTARRLAAKRIVSRPCRATVFSPPPYQRLLLLLRWFLTRRELHRNPGSLLPRRISETWSYHRRSILRRRHWRHQLQPNMSK